MKDSMNPWAGLASYQDGDWRLFCGRDSESYDVARLIDNNVFVTLYGKSGIGKSSLLNAGVSPRLRKEGYLPVTVRLGLASQDDSIQSILIQKLDEVLSTVGQSKDTGIVVLPGNHSDETWLWSYFARTRFEDKAGHSLFPVFILDQFEEILRSRQEDAGVLLRQISYMMDESHALDSMGDYQYDYNFRFVVSIREDELFRLEDCLDSCYLPEMKKCRYRLRELSTKGVKDVILIPGKPFIADNDKEPVVDAIIKIVGSQGDGIVSTNILSLVCSRSYDEMKKQGLSMIDVPLIERMLSDNLFEKYYLEAIQGFPSNASAFIEDHLVDSADRRNSVSEVDFFKAVPNGEILIEDGPKKILQRVSVMSGSSQTRIELVHDSFCEPISRLRKKRQQKRRSFVAAGFAIAALLILGVSFAIIRNMRQREWKLLENQSKLVAETAIRLANEGDYITAKRVAAAALPADLSHPKDRPYVPRAEYALFHAWEGRGGILRGHQGGVNSAIYTPDGKRIISASDDHTIRIWDSETGEPVGNPLTGHEDKVNVVVISPDGKRIISGSDDKTIRIWDLETGVEIVKPIALSSTLNSISISPDGKRIISGSDEDKLRMWDSETGEQVGEVKIQDDGLSSVAYSPDGKLIASCSWNGTVYICDNNLTILHRLSFPFHEDNKMTGSLAFSPDGKHIAGARNFSICVWDCETGKLALSPSTPHAGSIGAIAYSPDGKFLITGAFDLTIHLYNSKTGEPIKKPYEGHTGFIRSIAFNPEGNCFVSASKDKTIRIWDVDRKNAGCLLKWQRRIKGNDSMFVSAMDAVFSPDGKRIAVGTWEGYIITLNSETGEPVHELFKGHNHAIDALAYSPDGNLLVSGSRDSTICIWNSSTGEQIGNPLTRHDDRINKIAFSPDGKRIASASSDKTIRIWDIETGQQVGKPLEGHTSSIVSLAYFPDGRHLVSSSNDIRIWDSETGEIVCHPFDSSSVVKRISISPDGKMIASGSTQNMIRFWDSKTRKLIGNQIETTPSGFGFMGIVFSPNGKHILAETAKNPYSIWDVETGEMLIEIPNTLTMPQIAFNPEGTSIFFGDYADFFLMDISLESVLNRTRSTYPPLNKEERIKFSLE